MSLLDRRLPGVYIDVEDRSYAESSPDTGRSGFIVLLSDRGEHNKVVELNSIKELHDQYGQPDFIKYGQSHYLAEKFLTYSSKLYVVRPVLLDPDFSFDTTENDCMSISNINIYVRDKNNPKTTDIDAIFNFEENSNIISYDTTSALPLSVGDWISRETDYENLYQILEIEEVNRKITLDKKYPLTVNNTYCKKVEFIYSNSIEKVRDISQFDTQDTNVAWYFYAVGAGEPYNSFFIRGVKNTQIEKMYTDSDGNVLYPNMFMDISIYKYNSDSTISLLEGPFTVSLVDRLPNGQIIKDVFSGQHLYISTVINNKSKYIRCQEALGVSKLMTVGNNIKYPYDPDVKMRFYVQTLFANGKLIGTNNIGSGGLFFKNGSNGTLFLENGMLNLNDTYTALVAQAYAGTLKSIDGSIELIGQSMYPLYNFDYVLCGGYSADVCASAREMVDTRDDCLLISDTGRITNSPDEDANIRQTELSWNTWNASLYYNYREIYDKYTGKRFYITPVYHAIERHLFVDTQYWLAEPVAGIEKGAISEPIKLSYKPSLSKLADLVEMELNPVIMEPDGVYILTQFSTWKRLSIMKRLHVVKFIHFIKKQIPKLLKDILERKSTQFWINQAKSRTTGFLNRYLESTTNDKFSVLKSFDVSVNFDDVRSELNVVISLTFIRAIERIIVNILVS